MLFFSLTEIKDKKAHLGAVFFLIFLIFLFFSSLSLADKPRTTKKNSHQKDFCQEKSSLDVPLNSQLGKSYDRLFPYYIKYCALSKYTAAEGMGLSGSVAGHGAYYLKGVCQNEKELPSGLKLCDQDLDYSDPNLGVGLSVDRGFKNANFLVVQGLETFLGSYLQGKEIFDLDKREEIVERLSKEPTFNAINFHETMFPQGLQESKKKYLIRYTLGSDHHLSLGRNLFCINIPITRKMMAKVVAFLNWSNRKNKILQGKSYRGIFFPSKKEDSDYHWHGLHDNCIHPIINALSQFGLLKKQRTNQTLIKQLCHITTPGNVLLDLHKRIHQRKLDIDLFLKDKRLRKTFLEEQWTPFIAGSLLEFIPFYRYNKIAINDPRILILPKVLRHTHKSLKKIFDNPSWSQRGQEICQHLYFVKNRFVSFLGDLSESLLNKEKDDENSNLKKNVHQYLIENIYKTNLLLKEISCSPKVT